MSILRFSICLLACACAGTLTTPTSADIVLFDFVNATSIDDQTAGASLTATSSLGTVVTLTTTSILAPDLSNAPPAGALMAAETNLANAASDGFLGVNNLSIANGAFTTLTGIGPNESTNFNDGEQLTFVLDTDATFNLIDFANISGTEIASVTVNGVTTQFPNGNTGDDFNDPLNGLLITAGTPITFGSVGTDNSFLIDDIEFHIPDPVPEPGSALLGVFAMVGLFGRRRRG